ncbi:MULTISPECIES: helix-turn-helix transcriptional regulator [Pseudomonas]|jgi:prophage regulatory protein|uniref:helix-turn-helix transcriptional regulator n=1 Tax=Pseudomonas TaxID=286 RepID=UPI00035C7672|nr:MULTISPECIES: AlpA family transcriptional regulator [Pseudomonas]MBC8877717.1 AlpA family transcriptional regulator [Pseudomonas cerasi]MBS7423906.1 AlpA family transcriptional regulator [Pseudomonas syringae]MDF5890711.1 AlpA family transcriptional regulator [Pseudomonas syringae pv. syringae]MDU8619151.1 AlpA family transcriptional regulator [Pseudomonas syringae]PBP48713.1 AlpA family transcriptional regulator [Pseudomonas syringae]
MASTTENNALPRRFIRIKEVLSTTSLSQSELYRRIKAGTFPAQVKLAPGHSVWVQAEVDSWIADRIAECRGEVA